MTHRLPKKYRNGKHDCLRRAVAYVTGRKRVPHFTGLYGGYWKHHLGLWCERHGFVVIHGKNLIMSKGVRCWINIKTTRHGSHHAVVMEAKPNKPAEVVLGGEIPTRNYAVETIVILKRPIRKRDVHAEHHNPSPRGRPRLPANRPRAPRSDG